MPRFSRRHSARRPAIIALEARLAPSVTFSGGSPVAPVTNTVDQVLGTVSGFVPIEPMISVNPTDPTNLIVTSHNGMRISTNGGLTFPTSGTFLPPPGTTFSGGDTDTAFDAQGRLFWSNLAGVGTNGVSVSQVNPTTGAPISSVNVSSANDDKSFLVADTSPSSPFVGNLYVTWTRFGVSPPQIFFARSTDHGASWSVPIQLSTNAESFSWPVDVGVAPNGDVYVAYHSQTAFNGIGEAGGNPTGTAGKIIVVRSTDGGLTFPQKTNAFGPGAADITFNVQSSTGNIPQTRFWTQGSAQPWVLADPVRPGNVYVVAVDDPDDSHGSGDEANLVIARSTNNGQNWTTATIDAGPSNSFQLFPSAAIDKFGNIVVAWYDNRRGLTNASGRFLLDVFATYSTDGGVTWAPSFQVNDPTNPFDPDNGAFNRFTGPPATTRIGEYFGIALYGDTAHLAWNGTTTGHKVVYDSFPLAGTLTVNGDDAGPTSDNIVIGRMAANTNYLEVVVNGVRQYAGLAAGLTGITVSGGALNDTLTLDFSNGTFNLSGGVQFNGGSGVDMLVGPDTTATWVINSAGGGAFNFGGPGSTFSNAENLSGGGFGDAFVFANGGSLSGQINGGGGADSLRADDAGRDFFVSGPDSGFVTDLLPAGFVSVEKLVGGAGNDSLSVLPGGFLSAAFDGQGGGDSVFFANLPSQTITMIGLGALDGFDTTGGTNVGGGLFDIEAILGSIGGAGDKLVGPNSAGTWALFGSNAGFYTDELSGRFFGFNAVEFVAGGTANDRLVIQPGGSLSGSFDGASGQDTVDVSGLGAHQFVLTGQSLTDGFDLAGVPEVGGLTNIDALVGSASPDTLTGLNEAVFWIITGPDAGTYLSAVNGRPLDFSGIEGLTGGTDNDLFGFFGGSLSGQVAGGFGINRLQGDNAGRTFTLTGPDTGTIGGILPAGFSQVHDLQAGTGDDTLAVLPGGSLTGSFSGGPGIDTADFSATGSQQFPIAGVDGTGEIDVDIIPGVIGFMSNVNALVGSSLGTTDRIFGLNRPTTWVISGPNSGAYIDDLTGAKLTFAKIENLVDGLAAATLQLLPGGSLSGVFDAGAGADTLDLSALPNQHVQITGPSFIDGFDLVPVLPIAGGFADIDRIVGSSKSLTDRLTGWNGPVTWTVKAGTDQSVYAEVGNGHTLLFTGFDQLYGGSDSDALTVDFSAGIPILALGITFNGQGGADLLNVIGTGASDQFRLTNAALAVNGRPIRYANVETIQVLGGAGKDLFSSPSATLPAWLSAVDFFGEDGDDTAVVTPALSSVLHIDGGAGKDTLKIARGSAISLAPLPPSGAISGTYLFKNRKTIEFDGIEVRAIGTSQVFP